MSRLKDLFDHQQAGLTVYAPDCAQSRLWGNLDAAIQTATGLQIVRRHWIHHDRTSVMRFYRGRDDEPPIGQDPVTAIQNYDTIPAAEVQPGHLLVKLLLMGPSLLTIWRGEHPIPALLRLKGTTQPAEAAEGSIRGGFWCDNGVCNLLHSSDDGADAVHELAALGLQHWLDAEVGSAAALPPVAAPETYAAHSGISILCDVVHRVLHVDGHPSTVPPLPASGSAKETNARLSTHLRETAARYPQTAPVIDAFLGGDLGAITTMLESLPVTRWEHFVIQCGAVNRDHWNRTASL